MVSKLCVTTAHQDEQQPDDTSEQPDIAVFASEGSESVVVGATLGGGRHPGWLFFGATQQRKPRFEFLVKLLWNFRVVAFASAELPNVLGRSRAQEPRGAGFVESDAPSRRAGAALLCSACRSRAMSR